MFLDQGQFEYCEDRQGEFRHYRGLPHRWELRLRCQAHLNRPFQPGNGPEDGTEEFDFNKQCWASLLWRLKRPQRDLKEREFEMFTELKSGLYICDDIVALRLKMLREGKAPTFFSETPDGNN